MDGVTVLYNYADDRIYDIVLMIVAIMIIIFAILLITSVILSNSGLFTISIIAVFLFLLIMITIRNATGQVEVLVDDSVSFNEFMDNYDVIEKNGMIWTVTEKK